MRLIHAVYKRASILGAWAIFQYRSRARDVSSSLVLLFFSNKEGLVLRGSAVALYLHNCMLPLKGAGAAAG